jgi:hypothetical protein
MNKIIKVRNNINELIIDGVKPEQLENVEELKSIYDVRNSFYKKAYVGQYTFTGGIANTTCKYLKSYDTIVACIWINQLRIYGYFSQTTARHIREFAKQNGFDCVITAKDMKETAVFNK